MDETEVRSVAGYIEGLEKSFGDWDCHEAVAHRQLIKLHLTIERLARAIPQTRDDGLRSLLTILQDRARRCKQCMEGRLTVHT